MNLQLFVPGIICIGVALVIMFRLMRYAKFYSPSYFFCIGVILPLEKFKTFNEPGYIKVAVNFRFIGKGYD